MNLIERLKKEKVVVVVRTDEIEQARKIIDNCISNGLNLIEITYTQSFASELIKEYADKAVVGAGSVLDKETAKEAISSGATFVVAPNFSNEVLEVCKELNTPYVPGTLTVNEIVSAVSSGCEIVKLFPASTMGPGFIKGVKGPIKGLNIMPTGGINIDNAQEYLDAGAICVGVGSEFNKNLDNDEKLEELIKKYVKLGL